MEIGLDIRNADELQELPSHWTQRTVFRRFCAELGYEVKLRNDKGTLDYALIEGFEGTPHKPCAWSTFQNYWKSNHPKLVIPED